MPGCKGLEEGHDFSNCIEGSVGSLLVGWGDENGLEEEKWLDSGHILKVEWLRLVDGLHLGVTRERKSSK